MLNTALNYASLFDSVSQAQQVGI